MITGAIFLASHNAFSKTDFNLYSIPDGVKDLTFTISSEQLNKVLRSKKILNPEQLVSAQAFWYKGRKKIVLQGAKNLKKEVKDLIREAFEQKAALVWGNDFSDWTRGYSEEKSSEGQLLYTDPTGILEKSEISINHSKERVVINEKKPIGSIRTNLELTYPKWSKLKGVVETTSRIAYEGSRVIRTNIQVEYKKIISGVYLPRKISAQSTQSVTFESAESLDRKVNEEFIMSGYKINKGIAEDKF